MSAHFVGDLEITDPGGFDAYRGAVPALIAKYGGRYLVRGGAFEVLEGATEVPGGTGWPR